MTWAIETRELTRRFGSFTAVDRVSLRVRQGSVMGHDLRREAEAIRRRAGYMSQRFSLYNDLTVAENLTFYGQVYGLKAADLAARREELLGWAGLIDQQTTLAGALSGGLRQRLSFACAILHRPPLLLLDEPISGVDAVSRRKFWDLIYDLADQGTTV